MCNPLEYQICHDLGFAFTEKNIKDNILKMFIHPNGTVRIVIATMGLDRPNVRNTRNTHAHHASRQMYTMYM